MTLRVGRWARWITEYYPCERVEEESADRWLVSLRASDLDWARRLVLGLGPDVTVVGPAALVEEVRAEARAALARYDEFPPTEEPERSDASTEIAGAVSPAERVVER